MLAEDAMIPPKVKIPYNDYKIISRPIRSTTLPGLPKAKRQVWFFNIFLLKRLNSHKYQ
jgi:hypothetical protein